jgi:hypothetical protein
VSGGHFVDGNATIAKVGMTSNDTLLAQLSMPNTATISIGTDFRSLRDPDIQRVAALEKTEKSVSTKVGQFSSAPKYEPDKWNKDPGVSNCYVYAANDFNPKYSSTYTIMDPGNYGPENGINIYSTDPKELQKFANLQIDGAIADGMKWTGQHSKPAPGYYKVALLVKPATGGPNDGDVMDYHWVRQDSNGKWSHKPGETPVTNLDSSGKVIADPSKANFGGYRFVGYFDVPRGGIKLRRGTDASPTKHNDPPGHPTMKAPPMGP